MQKIIFIVPYYGRFPDYFNEWLYTASFLGKQRIDFLLVTDIEIGFDLPENFKVFKITFADLKAKFSAKLGFEVSLERPYKLCDFKPAFGFIFDEYISQYDFWGHCDVDLLWGDVGKFITDDVLSNYDKIQYLGHFVLYRNKQDINTLFMRKGGKFNYRTVFTSNLSYSFDEHPGMMMIAQKNGVKTFVEINQADVSPIFSRIKISRVKNYDYQIIYWENGAVKRAYINEDGKIETDEFMYVHFQRRNLKMSGVLEREKCILVLPSEFKCIDKSDITKDFIISNSMFCGFDGDKKDAKAYKKNRIKGFLSSSVKEKIIAYKINRASMAVNKKIIKGSDDKNK